MKTKWLIEGLKSDSDDEECNPFTNGFEYDDDSICENTTTVRNAPKSRTN